MVTITKAMEGFILHWGEMGTKWGINRTVAQIHALLYLSAKPLNAEEIAEALSVARSNVSNSLKELQGWGIVKNVHVMGDRRDHFESMSDVWSMFMIILDKRKERECDPTLHALRELRETARKSGKKDEHTVERIEEMLYFFETMGDWYLKVRKFPRGTLLKFVKMGDRVKKLLGSAKN